MIEAVFFDAGGTLFEVRGSVGEVYARAAANRGVEIPVSALDRAFAEALRGQPPLTFAGLAETDLEQSERAWWREVVGRVFGDRMPPASLEALFAELYELFRCREPWHVFPDTLPALEALARRGLRLGVISNFDSRLAEVLEALGLARFFQCVAISSRAGAAKPDRAIFDYALERIGAPKGRALHVGDSPNEDIAGALGAGMPAVLLDRTGRFAGARAAPRIATLTELPGLLEGR